eukprot:711744-Prorocentrum_minimum.AAC.3
MEALMQLAADDVVMVGGREMMEIAGHTKHVVGGGGGHQNSLKWQESEQLLSFARGLQALDR